LAAALVIVSTASTIRKGEQPMPRLKSVSTLVTAAATALCVGAGLGWAADTHEGQQLVPILTYRTGPYAPSGIPFIGGLLDYIRYVNEAEGGVNGVKLYPKECETAYTIERGIECYERLKHGYDGAPTAFLYPHSSGLDAALLDKARHDRVVVTQPGGGQAFALDGRVFPYSFPLLFDYWSEASIIIKYLADQYGGYDKLKGVKLVTLYHDSGYGRDTIEPLKILSEKYGFVDIQIPVPHPGEQQQAQWQRIKQEGADWVFLRGWGVMTPVAIKTAARVGFPADHIIGDIWSGSEDDTRPAGAVAKGYLAVSAFPPGTKFPILEKLKTTILDANKSDLKDPSKFGTVYYNFGVIEGIIAVEIIRAGQAKFGHRPLNNEEGRWAVEHLELTPARVAEIGATGLVSPFKVTWTDHEGGAAAKIQQWTGKQWKPLTGWIPGDRSLFRDALQQKAADYAKEKGIVLRTSDATPGG
jgi:branched-chain amino acid transport system substrate-binding protein